MELIPGLPNDIGRECLLRVSYEEFPISLEICKGWKTEIESDQFHRLRKANGFTRVLIVLTQAAARSPTTANNLAVYEPDTGSWSILPGIPGHPDGFPLFCQCAGVGRYLVVVGGWNPTTWTALNIVHIYDFISAVWKRGADMPGPPRSFFGCAPDSNRTAMFVAGGHDDYKNALRSALMYDINKDEWVPLPDMSNERDECKGIFHCGKFHVIGGYRTDLQGQFHMHAETFDIAKWKWSQVETNILQTGMCSRNFVVDYKGNMFRCSAGHVSVLDCSSTWREVTKLPADVSVGPFMLMWRDKIFVIGSKQYGGTQSCYVFEFKGENGVWTEVVMPTGITGNVQARCTIEI